MAKRAYLATVNGELPGFLIPKFDSEGNPSEITFINPDVPNSNYCDYFIPIVYGPKNLITLQSNVIDYVVCNEPELDVTKSVSEIYAWMAEALGRSETPMDLYATFGQDVLQRVLKYTDEVTTENGHFISKLEAFKNGTIDSRGVMAANSEGETQDTTTEE